LIESGIDPRQVEESTPTERLRRMQDMLRFIEAARDAQIADIRKRTRA
jgi:hypothetical protein